MIRRLNRTILACVLLLSGMGLLSLWQTAPPTDLTGESITKSIFLRQATFLAAGLALMILTALPGLHHYRRGAVLLYAACAAALAALLVVGRYTRGARGWFAVGPINVQPAEFMKIAFVLTVARSLMYAKKIQEWRGLLVPIALTALPAALVLLQPDLGTALLFVPTLLAMLFVAGARKRHLAVILIVLLVSAPAAFLFVLKDYQRARLVAFLSPEKYPQLAFQPEQSKKACASGGVVGRGLGESGAALPFYIPDRHTDFVFSIIAEELGFAGSSFLLLLFGIYFSKSFQAAWQSREPFGRLAITGLTVLLGTQTLINLGMTLGVAPITGVTLPFVSYGGSSLLTCALAAGIALNVSARWQPGFSSHDMAGGSTKISNLEPHAVRWL